MRQRPAGVLPVARRGCDPDPETAAGGAERGGAGANAAIRRPRPHHRLRRQHAAAGLRQRDPDQPDLESRVRADAEQSGLAVATGASFFKPPKTVPTRTTLSHPAHAAIGFTHLENRLKNRDLDDRRFWKRLYYGPSPNVDKTRVFRTGRPLIKRCVHEIAGDRAFLSPSPRGYVLSKPGWADATPQDLTPASGRQDHTILPYAEASLVSVLSDRSQVFRPALRSHRAQNAAASTATHPAFRDGHDTPLLWGGMARSCRDDLPDG